MSIRRYIPEVGILTAMILFWLFGKRRYVLTVEVYGFE